MENEISNSRFNFRSKWFWIGVLIGFFGLIGGLAFGIALAVEKENRKEGLALILISLIFFVLKTFVLAPWMAELGYLPQYQIVENK